MKKTVSMILILVFAASFVVGLFATESTAGLWDCADERCYLTTACAIGIQYVYLCCYHYRNGECETACRMIYRCF